MSAVTHVGPCFDRFLKNASEERQEQTGKMDESDFFKWLHWLDRRNNNAIYFLSLFIVLLDLFCGLPIALMASTRC